jgi:hypothetical protein
MNRKLNIPIQLFKWDPAKYKAKTMLRALTVLNMLGKGDNYIAAHERQYDNQFEMGDGSQVVALVVQAAKTDGYIESSIRRSQYANFESWTVLRLSAPEVHF